MKKTQNQITLQQFHKLHGALWRMQANVRLFNYIVVFFRSCTTKQVANNSKYAFTKVWLRQE